MIKVDRRRVSPSQRWLDRAARETEKVIAHYSKHADEPARYNFPSLWNEVRKELEQLFYNKCAYCESPFGAASYPDVDNFRPKIEARDKTTGSSPLYYCWLAYEWRNLYLACPFCNRAKRNLFPMDGSRCDAFAPLKTVYQEKPLLIDPCEDDPEEHFIYRSAGESIEIIGIDKRGQATIELLSLNRPVLIRARYDVFRVLRSQTSIEQARGDSAPYAGMIRHLLPSKTRAVQKRVSRQKESDTLRNAQIQTIDIKNFRALKSFRFRLEELARAETADTEPGPPWLTLLGENSTGKSTLLHALAVALEGDAGLKKRHWTPEDILHRAGSRRATTGHIEVQFTHGDKVRIAFDKKGVRFEEGKLGARAYMRAYGATRLPPRRGDSENRKNPGRSWSENLFDPWVALTDPARWFSRLDKENLAAVRVLGDMLSAAKQKVKVNQISNELHIRLDGTDFSWRELSDGFQSILCLCADLIRGVPGTQDMREASGIVLLDEIGTHLHPKWKMRIVDSLRNCFPLMQFIITTHEPLCLRGLRQGEIALLTRENGKVTLIDDLPSPENLRIDQLLTSRLFGLESTIDPAIDGKFQRYYKLLQTGKTDSTEYHRLRAELSGHGILGYTRRDQLIYDVLDKYLSKEMRVAARDREKLRESTLRRVAAVWTRVESYLGRES